MLTMSRTIPSKEELTDEALKYDEKEDGGYLLPPSTSFMKGVRRGIKLCLPFIQDSFRHKIEKIIK